MCTEQNIIDERQYNAFYKEAHALEPSTLNVLPCMYRANANVMKVTDLEMRQVSWISPGCPNIITIDNKRIFPGSKERNVMLEEGSERCALQRTQPAIAGFEDGEGAMSQGI